MSTLIVNDKWLDEVKVKVGQIYKIVQINRKQLH